MTSAGMRAMLQAIRRDFQSWTVILDMPPVLTGDWSPRSGYEHGLLLADDPSVTAEV